MAAVVVDAHTGAEAEAAREQRVAVMKLQASYRGKQTRKEMHKKRAAVTRLQARVRGRSVRKAMREKQLRKAKAKKIAQRERKEMLVLAKHLNGVEKDADGYWRMEKCKFHVFLSHVWNSAQDQMRFLKTRLLTMIPDVKVFLASA